MSKKKTRAFFVCPRWDEIASTAPNLAQSGRVQGAAKAMAAIRDGKPVARSTLRKALLGVQQASGRIVDVDAYIVDERVARPR